MKYRSANPDLGAPIQSEESQQGLRSANGIEERLLYHRSTMGGGMGV